MGKFQEKYNAFWNKEKITKGFYEMDIKKITSIVEEQQREKGKEVYYVKELPNPRLVNERTILGNMSMSQRGGKKRIIKKSTAIKLDNGLMETPPKIARIYLKKKFVRSPRIKPILAEKLIRGLRSAPFYNKPCQFEMGFYIDIKSAYPSIMNAVGWDVDYNPSKWLSRGTIIDDFPFLENKLARSCLVSVTAINPLTKKLHLTVADPNIKSFWDTQKIINDLANPALQRIIMDVLNSIASQAVKAGAVYVNTDGFIAPNEYIAGHIIDIIQNWGLEARVKAEGAGGVKSRGVYKVGSKISEDYIKVSSENFHNHIYEPKYIKWLEKSFSFWSSSGKIDTL